MARGKIRTLSSDGRGVVAEKTKRFTFRAEDVVEGFAPAVGVEVRFDKEGARALRVRPLDYPEPAPRGPAAGGPAGPGPDPGDGFVNPYNFVPLGPITRSPAPADRMRVVEHTGRLVVELRFRTPASVSPVKITGPDPSDDRADERERKIGAWRVRRDGTGHALIPGSSLKGALRVVFEALSGSCLSVFDKDAAFSWRPIAPSLPGFLSYRESGWVLQPADDIRVEHLGADDHGGQPKTVRAEHRRAGLYEARRGGQEYRGILHVTDWPEKSQKRYQRVFVAKRGPALSVPEAVVKAADAAHEHSIGQDRKAGTDRVTVADGDVAKGTRPPREPLTALKYSGGSRPVWYRLERDRVTEIGPVALFRRLFRGPDGTPVTLGAVLEREDRDYAPCADRTDGRLCPACAVFGTTWRDQESSGWRGRVCFTTARSGTPVPPADPILLPPAGAPHASAQTFYLWDPAHPGDAPRTAYGSPHSRIRGRKLYWHRRGTTVGDLRAHGPHIEEILGDEKKAKDQLRRLEVLPPDTRFTFEVGFDGLSGAELGLLLLTLEPARLAGALGSAAEVVHKIGGGKPLGMGSADLRIQSARLLQPERRYRSLREPGDRHLDGDELEAWVAERCAGAVDGAGLLAQRPDLRALLALLDWNAVEPALLRYPPGQDAPHESYQWFMEFAAKDHRTGAPTRGRQGNGPDPLRPAEEVARGASQLATAREAPERRP